MLTKKQSTIYNWLNDDLCYPVYAEVYKGAVELISQCHAGHITLVAHVGRDLMNGLVRTTFDGKNRRVQYEERVSEIEEIWDYRTGYTSVGEDYSALGLHPVKIQTCNKISMLIEEHRCGCKRNADAPYLFFQKYFGINDKEKIQTRYLDTWKKIRTLFIKYAHIRESPYRSDSSVQIKDAFLKLERYLYHAASSQKLRLEDLNAILDSTNSRDDR